MIFYLLMAGSLISVIYGFLINKRYHTPLLAKSAVEEEFIDDWCKTEGISKMVLGIDFVFIAMYFTDTSFKFPGLIIGILLAVYITKMRYGNNAKYMK